ncbi:hypothetical protein [Bradyrhizobium sp.]|uniref:hypothetical protein n=1 Tax=Bradyrhizobium sp. TaxID=376 RepID=UPI001D84ED9E|nr:hypothetical protein [Bradyrhizobium sp.]MBI5320767.1 hypothetical protein [Bradyrhizobium sp.]
MRKIIMLGTLIALFGAGAVAQAEEAVTTQPGAAVGATRPAMRGEEYRRERHHDSRSEYREARRGYRNHHDDDGHERHDESREHGRYHR